MDKILSLLSDSRSGLKLGTPLNTKDIISVQKALTRQGLPVLPSAFINFLRHYNGVKSQDSHILGIAPVSDEQEDIVSFNDEYNQSSDMVILGYDDFGYLVYNTSTKTYQLVDKEGGMVIEEFFEDELEYALISVIHVNCE